MEGIVDAPMRAVLTRVGGYDWCVTEFARVSTTPISRRRLQILCPELGSAARTPAGTPVRLQLLGSDPGRMAESAALAASCQPFGIDLNFGCPAPTVNRHRGGAALLAEPDLLHAIAAAVRAAVPRPLIVSAKMRLGIDDPARSVDNAQALAAGGVDELVVHARTRDDGYRHPARWEWLARVREAVGVPVIANGDILSTDDWTACRAISGCDSSMLGRGALADPFLARRIRGESIVGDWAATFPLLNEFWQAARAHYDARQAQGRLKQWLALLRRRHPAASVLFSSLRALRELPEIDIALCRHAQDFAIPCPSTWPA